MDKPRRGTRVAIIDIARGMGRMKAVVEFFKEWWWVLASIAAIVLALAAFIGPGPPRSVTIAGGAAGGAYARAAETLAKALRDVGVSADVIATQGTVDNLRLLRADSGSRADVALVQGGVATEADAANVRSLGGVFLEPVWVFVVGKPGAEAREFAVLRGKRVAIGAEGSGARAAAERFLRDQDLLAAITAIPLGGAEAAAALKSGAVDAVVLVASPSAAWVRALAADRAATLIGFERAPAFERLYPFVAGVTVQAGVLDLGADLPARPTPLVALTAQIAVREDLHPALQGVLLEAMKRLYARGDVLSPPGAFPDPVRVDLPLSEEARRYYETGPTFLRRVLPYWWANLLERAWIVILPALTLLIPLIRAAPPVYRWRVRSRIYRWYRDLTALEIKGRNAQTEAERSQARAGLAQMLRETAQIEVPLGYADELFRLRSHIAFVDNLVAAGPAEEVA
jgi:TRAP transporter TAXI family solute receptor